MDGADGIEPRGVGLSSFEALLAGDEGLFPMPWMMALNFRFVAFILATIAVFEEAAGLSLREKENRLLIELQTRPVAKAKGTD